MGHFQSEIELAVPGKIMLVGEWAILQKGNQCISLAVDRYARIIAKKSSQLVIRMSINGFIPFRASLIGTTVMWDQKNILSDMTHFDIVKRAIETAYTYLNQSVKKLIFVDLCIDTSEFFLKNDSSGVVDTEIKIGLGSSAAVTVGVIKAILALHGLPVRSQADRLLLFKLAYFAHSRAQGHCGSGFDLATSAYEKSICYQMFDMDWFNRQRFEEKAVITLVHKPWPLLKIMPVFVPKTMHVWVGFVGQSSSTRSLVKQMTPFIKERGRTFCDIMTHINEIVLQMHSILQRTQKELCMRLIKQNRTQLKRLQDYSGVELETNGMAHFIEHIARLGGSAKLSGAGGGDCIIAIMRSEQALHSISDISNQFGVTPLSINILN